MIEIVAFKTLPRRCCIRIEGKNYDASYPQGNPGGSVNGDVAVDYFFYDSSVGCDTAEHSFEAVTDGTQNFPPPPYVYDTAILYIDSSPINNLESYYDQAFAVVDNIEVTDVIDLGPFDSPDDPCKVCITISGQVLVDPGMPLGDPPIPPTYDTVYYSITKVGLSSDPWYLMSTNISGEEVTPGSGVWFVYLGAVPHTGPYFFEPGTGEIYSIEPGPCPPPPPP